MDLRYWAASTLISLILSLAIAIIKFFCNINLVGFVDKSVISIFMLLYYFAMNSFIKSKDEYLLSFYKDVDLLNSKNTILILLSVLGLIGLIIFFGSE